MSAKPDWDDRVALVLFTVFMVAVATIACTGAVFLAFKTYSAIDCEFNPNSERCIALEKEAWRRAEEFGFGRP